MREPIRVALPAEKAVLEALRAGDEVRLWGVVYTARDATHERIAAELRRSGVLPYGLQGQVLFYAGPTPARPGLPAGAIGPTTARRMDAWTPALLDAGVTATIGKGARSEEVRRACVRNGAVYFAAVGGAAALLGSCVVAAEVVAWPELGTEALMRLTLEGLPAFVALDSVGRDLYASAPHEWQMEVDE